MNKWEPTPGICEEFTPLLMQLADKESELSETVRLFMLRDIQELDEDEFAATVRKREIAVNFLTADKDKDKVLNLEEWIYYNELLR